MPESETPETPALTALATSGSSQLVAPPTPAIIDPPEIPVAEDMVVIAKSPEEMEVAQKDLVGWAEQRIANLEQELAEAQTNLDTAAKRKWATAPFRKALTLTQGRVNYFKRIKAALDAGYVIMPDLPGATIAVRTSQKTPRRRTHESHYYSKQLPGAVSDASEVGKGRYVTPEIKYQTWNKQSPPDAQGRVQTTHMARARSFDSEYEFPIKFVKPQIFDDASRAMMLKVFDEIGIIGAGSAKPGQKLRATTVSGDPVVLGRVVRYEGTKRFTTAFLITWWLDTKAIE